MPTTIVTADPQPVEENEYLFLDSGGDNSEYDWDEAFNEPTWDFDENFAGGGSGNLADAEEEDRIENNLEDPCARNIFKQLENGIYQDHPSKPEVQVGVENILNLNLSERIIKLFNDSSSTHLTIQNGNTASNAFTVNTTITIGNDYLANATKLSIARTMIHESVHAYINGLYYTYSSFQDQSFADKLRRWAGENGYTNWAVIQHEFMGDYVDAIGYALYEWDKQYGTGGNLGWDYYQSMGWGGLFQVDPNGNIVAMTDSFKELVPDPNDRKKIADKLLNEQKGNSDAQVTECD